MKLNGYDLDNFTEEEFEKLDSDMKLQVIYRAQYKQIVSRIEQEFNDFINELDLKDLYLLLKSDAMNESSKIKIKDKIKKMESNLAKT